MDVLCEIRNRIAHFTLNRPAALNALSLDMVTELQTQLLRCAKDPAINAVLLRGAGEKAFCAGGDIRALYENHKATGKIDLEFFEREYPLDYLLRFYPKPVVAVINGIVMGGGMGLAQGARWRIVGERTRMAMPEVGIGFFPDVGGSYFLPRLPGALGNYLALTGSQIRGADALHAGLADCYLAPAAISQLDKTLDAIDWTAGVSDTEALDAAVRSLQGDPGPAPLLAWREAVDAHFAPADVRAILAALEREKRPQFAQWAQTTLETLRSRSPTMLAVAARQLARGRDMDFAGCLRMELGMVHQCFLQGDFPEGVRALLIDKDNAPRWKPPRLEDVGAAQVEYIFKDPWEGDAHPLAHIEGVLESCN